MKSPRQSVMLPSLHIVLTSTVHLAQVGEAPYIAQAHSIGDTDK